jgi:hypothetical protein
VSLRDAIAKICDSVVPSDYGSSTFETITGGKFQPGFGSTCGFLISYVLLQIGCLDATILNRDGAIDPETGQPTSYVPGANISRFVGGAKALGAWHTLADSPLGPSMGDLCYFSDGVNPHSEHVAVCRGNDGITLLSWDAGKTNASGQQCARTDARAWNPRTGSVAFIGGPRKLQGWACPEELPHDASLDASGIDPTTLLAFALFVAAVGVGVYSYA